MQHRIVGCERLRYRNGWLLLARSYYCALKCFMMDRANAEAIRGYLDSKIAGQRGPVRGLRSDRSERGADAYREEDLAMWR